MPKISRKLVAGYQIGQLGQQWRGPRSWRVLPLGRAGAFGGVLTRRYPYTGEAPSFPRGFHVRHSADHFLAGVPLYGVCHRAAHPNSLRRATRLHYSSEIEKGLLDHRHRGSRSAYFVPAALSYRDPRHAWHIPVNRAADLSHDGIGAKARHCMLARYGSYGGGRAYGGCHLGVEHRLGNDERPACSGPRPAHNLYGAGGLRACDDAGDAWYGEGRAPFLSRCEKGSTQLTCIRGCLSGVDAAIGVVSPDAGAAYLHCAGYLLQRHARGAGVCCRFRSDFAAVCGY